jgi:hypothetical protein
MTLFPVFSRRVVRELEKRGFIVVKIAPNKKYTNLMVYYFEETPELRQVVTELTK